MRKSTGEPWEGFEQGHDSIGLCKHLAVVVVWGMGWRQGASEEGMVRNVGWGDVTRFQQGLGDRISNVW